MAKTLLKMVLGVLLLSGLFFFMLQLWERNRSKPAAITPAQQEVIASIQDIQVVDAPEGAIVEIKNITGSAYSVSKDAKGLSIDFPDLKVTMANKTLTLPHPLVESIEVTETGAAGQNGAKVKVSLVEKVSFNTRQSSGSLFIDVTKMKDEPEITPTPEPTKKPKATLKKKGKATKPAKKSSKKSASQKRKSTPIFEDAPVKPKKTAKKSAAKSEEDEFLAQLGITDSSSAPTAGEDLSQVPEMPPEQVPAPSNDLLASGPNTNGPGNAPLQKDFDPSQITANMPPVTDLKVTVEEGITKVRITRGAKTKYKIFPKRNPNRIVIEFQNALNQLPPEMGGFAGSRVDRIVTSQFVGPEGTISRIELFLNSVPEINRTAVVNSPTLFELPIP